MKRFLVVDDHAVVRRGLRQILESEFSGSVVVEASTAEEALEQLGATPWSVIILDISLPGQSGLDLLKTIVAQHRDHKVLVLSIHPEDQFASRTLKAGASGYLTKESAPDHIAEAIRTIERGAVYVSPSLGVKLGTLLRTPASGGSHESLSDREFQILRLIGTGQTPSQIAKNLNISVKTVSTYRTRVLEKLNLRSTTDLIQFAIRNKLVE